MLALPGAGRTSTCGVPEAFMDFAVSPILVPVDFSRHSELAIRYAMALASRLEASVALLHVVEEPVAAGTWGSFESKISCRSLSISRSPRSSSSKRQGEASSVLLVPQRVNRVERRGLPRRIEAKEDPNPRGDAERDHHGLRRHDRRPLHGARHGI